MNEISTISCHPTQKTRHFENKNDFSTLLSLLYEINFYGWQDLIEKRRNVYLFVYAKKWRVMNAEIGIIIGIYFTDVYTLIRNGTNFNYNRNYSPCTVYIIQ